MKLRRLSPAQAFDDALRRSVVAGFAGFVIAGALQASGALPPVHDQPFAIELVHRRIAGPQPGTSVEDLMIMDFFETVESRMFWMKLATLFCFALGIAPFFASLLR